jgi:hypothetical protein
MKKEKIRQNTIESHFPRKCSKVNTNGLRLKSILKEFSSFNYVAMCPAQTHWFVLSYQPRHFNLQVKYETFTVLASDSRKTLALTADNNAQKIQHILIITWPMRSGDKSANIESCTIIPQLIIFKRESSCVLCLCLCLSDFQMSKCLHLLPW